MTYQPPPGYPPPPPSGYGPPPGYAPYGQPTYPAYGPYGQPPPPPRATTHASATASLWIGLGGLLGLVPTFVLGWSAITGIAAILLGSHALKKIAAEPGRFEGIGRARAGIVLGWAGCAVFGFWLGWRMGQHSILVGVLACACGLIAGAAAVLFASRSSWGGLRIVALASSPTMVVAGGVMGVVAARAQSAENAATCQKDEEDANRKLDAQMFSAAHHDVNEARDKCPDTEAARLAELDRQIAQQEQAAKVAAADRAAAEQAAAAAAKEKNAVQTFPAKSTEITSLYKRALGDTYAGRWEDANRDLGGAEDELATFAGTSVAQSKPWQDLNAQLTGLRQKIDPQLAQIQKQRSAREKATQAAQDDQTLHSLLAQYKDNEVRGDAIYKGKLVQFGGIVGDIKKDLTNDIYVTVGTGEWLQIPQVQCFFDDSKAGETARLTSGQHVRMRGTVKGLMMNVLIEDCDLVQ